jgi:hypothetical protein
MGCDIHGIIEQRKPGGQWEVCPAQIEYFSRDYNVFAHLGGVRTGGDVKPVAASRGLPSDACHDTHMKNCVYVSESVTNGCVSKSRAEDWISKGSSKWYREGVFVTNPDWHSHSWCTLNELWRSLNRIGWNVFNDYKHLSGIMGLSEKLGHECRFVFWFDN